MKTSPSTPPKAWPSWYDGQSINEALFCQEFLSSRKLLFTEGTFFTVNGRMVDETPLRIEIYQALKNFAVTNIPKKISNIIELLRITAFVEDFPPAADRIHLSNGTLLLDSTFDPPKESIVRSRFPVAYNPEAPPPQVWLRYQTNAAGRRVWGFSGIEPLLKLPMQTCDGWQRDYSPNNPFA